MSNTRRVHLRLPDEDIVARRRWMHPRVRIGSGGRVGSVPASMIGARVRALAARIVIVGAAVRRVVVAGAVVGSVVLVGAGTSIAALPSAAVQTTATTPTPQSTSNTQPATSVGGTPAANDRPAVSQGQVFAALFLVLVAAAWMVYRNRSTRDDIGDASRDDVGNGRL